MIRTGSIITHRHRKQAHYLAIKFRGENSFYLVRVKKQPGYPIADQGRYIEGDESAMTEVDFAPQYQDYTPEFEDVDVLTLNQWKASRLNPGNLVWEPGSLPRPRFGAQRSF